SFPTPRSSQLLFYGYIRPPIPRRYTYCFGYRKKSVRCTSSVATGYNQGLLYALNRIFHHLNSVSLPLPFYVIDLYLTLIDQLIDYRTFTDGSHDDEARPAVRAGQ